MQGMIERKLKKLVFSPVHMQMPEARDLLRSHVLFADLDNKTFDNMVWPFVKKQVYHQDQLFFSQGQTAT